MNGSDGDFGDNPHILHTLQSEVINEECPPLAVDQFMSGNKVQESGRPFFSYPVVIQPNEYKYGCSGGDEQGDGFLPCITPSPEPSEEDRQGKEIRC